MATIHDTPGDLNIIDTPTKSVCIRRVEPSHAERILGVRMAATAQMTTEYAYRLEQARALASRIRRAPLRRCEAEGAYRHWIPIASYCLPITTFTPKQAANLMSPVYQALLPPLGFNRHTPHAVLYGPHRLGGSSRHHLYSASGLQHINRFLGHLRQQDAIAKLYMTELNLLQLYSGTGTPILTTNYKQYSYVPNTRITFLWKFLTAINATITVSDAWTPPLVRKGDAYIMDKFRTRGYNNRTMAILNKCRMYLHIITVADIVNPHGTHVSHWAIIGARTKQSHLRWPRSTPPTQQNWALWKASLQRTLMLHVSSVQYPLGNRLHQHRHHQYYLPSHTRTFQFTQLKSSTRLKTQLALLPPPYIDALGHISLPRDDGKSIVHDILNGTLTAGNDESVKDSVSTHGYMLLPSRKKHWMRGHGYVSGTPNLLTSLRAEHSGSIAVLILLHMLTVRWGLDESTPPVTIHIDNKEKISRMDAGLPGLSIKAHLVPEYDLWAEAIHLTDTLPFPVSWQWVKAHQDTDKLDGRIIFGPHTKIASINIFCDRLATSAYRLPPPPSSNPHHMVSSKASLSINNQRQHTNLPESVLCAFHTPALRAHLYQRTGWSQSTFDMVDWDLTQSYMASLTDHQRTNAVKFLHDWQNTGSQNLQFQASEMDKPAAHKTYADSHTSCPFLCGETETPLHYLYCPSTAARQSSTSFLSLIQCTLKKEHTALPVYNAIMQHLKHHLHHPSSPRPIVPTITPPITSRHHYHRHRRARYHWMATFPKRPTQYSLELCTAGLLYSAHRP